jgi:hypothetical protein
MLRALLLSLALLSITGEAFALTVSWTCNPEPDMKEYRVESSKDAGKSWGIEATWPHPKPCTSPVSMGITRYMVPGERLFRLFAIDTAGNVARQPSEPASYTVKPSPIGSDARHRAFQYDRRRRTDVGSVPWGWHDHYDSRLRRFSQRVHSLARGVTRRPAGHLAQTWKSTAT